MAVSDRLCVFVWEKRYTQRKRDALTIKKNLKNNKESNILMKC